MSRERKSPALNDPCTVWTGPECYIPGMRYVHYSATLADAEVPQLLEVQL